MMAEGNWSSSTARVSASAEGSRTPLICETTKRSGRPRITANLPSCTVAPETSVRAAAASEAPARLISSALTESSSCGTSKRSSSSAASVPPIRTSSTTKGSRSVKSPLSRASRSVSCPVVTITSARTWRA